MSRALAAAMLTTDLLFLAYWGASIAAALGLFALPAELMYAHYDDPRVAAWNWSFLLPDVAFSATGLAAVAAARRGAPVWRPLAILSLAFTIMAGGMAVGYWTLLLEFDPGWFLPNLALMIWPLAFLPRLIRDAGRNAPE